MKDGNGKINQLSALKQAKDIEKEFFDFKNDGSVAQLQLEYQNPSEIFDLRIKTKLPRMSNDFVDQVLELFELIPEKYMLDIRVVFDDLEGYDEDELAEISTKNILLEKELLERRGKKDNILAFSLCTTGLLFFIVSLCVNRIWTDGGTLRDIVFFILDTFATVPFWGAMEVFVVDNRKRRRMTSDIAKRSYAIVFSKKQD